MKKALFKNPEYQSQFNHDGYLKFKLLNGDVIDQLAALQASYFPEDSEYFFSSSYLNDFEKKVKISQEIVDLLMPALKENFENFRSIGAAFLIKGIGPKSEMPMHQDWTIVDESQFDALNVWIPLMETNSQNGTLEVLKGSHRWTKDLRAPTLPFPFEGYQETLKKHLVEIPTQKGEIIVLNQALIHYSKPNLSQQKRPAITLGLVSKEAELSLHYWDKSNPGLLEKFRQEDDFLLKFENFHQSIFERPKFGTVMEEFDYAIPKYSESQIQSFLKKDSKKPGLFQRLFSRKKQSFS